MEDSERQPLVAELKQSEGRLLGLVEGLTPVEWGFHPAQGRWSIADCLEHVTRVENRIFGLIGQKLEQPPQPEKRDPANAKDSLLAKAVPDRTEARQAPEAAHPTGEWADPKELVNQFRSAHERITTFASTTNEDLRSYFIPHGMFGELDCYQWLMVLALHAERHARQMEEVMQDPAFPKRD